MFRMPRLRLLIVATFVALGVGVRADDKLPLVVEVETEVPMLRSAAAIPFLCRLNWSGNGLLEGKLEITLRDGWHVVDRCYTEELVLGMGERSFRSMLPAIGSSNPFNSIEVHLAWITKDGQRIPLHLPDEPAGILRVPNSSQRRSQSALVSRGGRRWPNRSSHWPSTCGSTNSIPTTTVKIDRS